MKLAVISDIHGYSLALASVLANIDTEPGIDEVIAAGDLCEGGPDPAGALDILTSRGIRAVRGNTDRDLVLNARTSSSFRWIREQLGPDRLATLADLPFAIRITPPNGRAYDDDLLIVHANPFDEDRHIMPDSTDREIGELIGETRAAVIAFGHIHIAYERDWNGIRLVDVSAVGNSRDGDLRSKWGLFTWDDQARRWHTEIRRVEYPLEATLAQLWESGLPNREKTAVTLQRATYGD